MTTTTSSTRADAATILRAVADLLENHPDVPLPSTRIGFFVRGEDAPATMAAIAAALPCQWQASVSRSGEHEWLDLTSPSQNVLAGTEVSISAPAADVCVPSGARTVTVWRPAAALAGFAGTGALGEVA